MTRVSTASTTRPDDTTQYAAGEVVGNPTTKLLKFGTNGAFGEISSAILIDSVVAGGTKPELDLLLYSSEPTIAADNAAFAPSDAQQKELVAVIPFLAANFVAAATNGHIVSASASKIPYVAPERVLYGVLVARNTYTPTALEEFTVRLGLSE